MPSTHIRLSDPPRLIWGETWIPQRCEGQSGREDPRELDTTPGPSSEQPRGGEEAAAGSSQSRDAGATAGRGRGARQGTHLGRSCRLPAAGGRAGSCSRSPPRCCDTHPHSPRCWWHTRSHLRGGDAGEPGTGPGRSSGPHGTGGRGPAETGKPHPSRQASREGDPAAGGPPRQPSPSPRPAPVVLWCPGVTWQECPSGTARHRSGPCSLRSHPRLPACPREWPLPVFRSAVGLPGKPGLPSTEARRRPPLSPHSCLRPGSGLHAPPARPRSPPLWSAGTLWHVSQAWGVGGHHWALAWRAEQSGDPTHEATLPTAPLSSTRPLWVQDGSTSPGIGHVAGGTQDAHEGLVAPWPHTPSRGPGDLGASFSRTPLGYRVTRGPGPSAHTQAPAGWQARGLRGLSSSSQHPNIKSRGVPQSHGECDPEASGDPQEPQAMDGQVPGQTTRRSCWKCHPPPGGSRPRPARAAVPKPKPLMSSAPLSTGMSLEGPWETPSWAQAAGAAKVPRERRHWNVTLNPSLRG